MFAFAIILFPYYEGIKLELANRLFSFFFFLVFLLNIAINGVYWCYRYCSKLFGKMRKETEFQQHHCRNRKKKYEREER